MHSINVVKKQIFFRILYEMKNVDYLLKIILMGDTNVGKTTFLKKLLTNNNTEVYAPTIGVDFSSKIVEDRNNNILKLHIWDTAGQEKFRSIVETYYRDAAGVILMYDITKKSSFDNLEYWIKEISFWNKNKERVPIIILGNKIDNILFSEVTKRSADKFAKKYNILYQEISVLKEQNLEKYLLPLWDKILERYKLDENFLGVKKFDNKEEEKNLLTTIKLDEKESENTCKEILNYYSICAIM